MTVLITRLDLHPNCNRLPAPIPEPIPISTGHLFREVVDVRLQHAVARGEFVDFGLCFVCALD